MTAYGSEELAVEAMRRGADDYISKGRLQIDELEMRIARALRSQKLESENTALKQQLDDRFGIENIIGESAAMIEVFDRVRQVAPTRASVLILGESGTGKELVAKAIHQLSPRARLPMVTVHCAGFPASLLESELFGHEKGAFTGAHERRIGRVEQAQGGTLFLDEIGEIDLTTQVKLLRFLGERTFERLGSNKTFTADVRLVSATNRRLDQMVKDGTFREDLYYRLRVVTLDLPPLRERSGDVPLLAQNFLKDSATENGKRVNGFTPEAMQAMQRCKWPGNVRELRWAIESAVVLTRGERIGLRDLPETVREIEPLTPAPTGPAGDPPPKFSIKEAERQLIIRALDECNGNRTRAARKLGMSRRTLHRKLHTYHLEDHGRGRADEAGEND
jgi:DNA-binding NtrC family response regulator